VDACDTFDPASAAGHGVVLPRLLWVRETGDAQRALKAFSLILQAGGFGLVVLDLADLPPATLRRFPWTTWMRIARIVEGRETAAVLIGAERIARSAGGVTIALETVPARWQGTAHRARLFTGLAAAPRVVRAK
jgi:recombination protein RecA